MRFSGMIDRIIHRLAKLQWSRQPSPEELDTDMPNPTPTTTWSEAKLAQYAVSFAQKHDLNPMEVLRYFVDLALIRRGLGREMERAAKYN